MAIFTALPENLSEVDIIVAGGKLSRSHGHGDKKTMLTLLQEEPLGAL